MMRVIKLARMYAEAGEGYCANDGEYVEYLPSIGEVYCLQMVDSMLYAYDDFRRSDKNVRSRIKHRVGAPALIFGMSYKSVMWFIHGTPYVDTQLYCEACRFDKENTMLWMLRYGTRLPDTMTREQYEADFHVHN